MRGHSVCIVRAARCRGIGLRSRPALVVPRFGMRARIVQSGSYFGEFATRVGIAVAPL
jgi:hypothetical protein